MKNNALEAKVHALYGNLITDSIYDELSDSKSKEVMFQIIKNISQYSALEKTEDIRNPELQCKIYKNYRLKSLKYFMKKKEENLFEAFFIAEELRELKSFIKLLGSTDRKNIENFLKHALYEDNLKLVSDSKITLGDYLRSLSDRPYYRVIEPFFNISESDFLIRNIYMEMNLDRWYYENILKTINEYSKNSMKDLKIFVSKQIDLLNLRWIYRVKTGSFQNKSLSELWVPGGEKIKEDFLFDIEAMNTDQFLTWMKGNGYGTILPTNTNKDYELDLNSHILEKQWCQLLFRQSNNTLSKVIAFTILSNFEVINLTRIFEGKDLGLQSKEIKNYLILKNKNIGRRNVI